MIDLDKYPHAVIGARLRSFRESLGLSIKDFSAINNFGNTQYTNWETGVRRIPIEGAAHLREKYDLTLDYIYLGKESAHLQNALNRS